VVDDSPSIEHVVDDSPSIEHVNSNSNELDLIEESSMVSQSFETARRKVAMHFVSFEVRILFFNAVTRMAVTSAKPLS
jgi:hypothetical protein